jgi:hypothetical protein
MDVKQLISHWRLLSNQLKSENARLEATRQDLQKTELRHSEMVSEWDLQKAAIQQTIDDVLKQVDLKQKELNAVEGETKALNAKVVERSQRNDEYKSVLRARQDAAATMLKTVTTKEEGVKQRINAFREARDAAKQQLMQILAKLEAAVPQEQQDHAARLSAINAKAKDVEAKIELEAKQWAKELAHREREVKLSTKKTLVEEAAAASHAVEELAALLRKAPPTRHLEASGEISRLKKQLVR